MTKLIRIDDEVMARLQQTKQDMIEAEQTPKSMDEVLRWALDHAEIMSSLD